MKLDERILPGKRPLTCFDTEQAKEFIGKKCYFSDDARDFMNLDKADGDTLFYVAELQNIWTAEEHCFADNSNDYRFILPFEWVKPEEPEKKWRPFTLDEFIDRFDLEVGTRVFLIRYKTHHEHQKRLLLTGLIHDKDPGLCGVCLGSFYFKFLVLFQMFDVRFGENDWQPFGVEE